MSSKWIQQQESWPAINHGVNNFSSIRNEVKNALQDATEIREAVLKLASVQERARLESFGIYVGQETESSTSEESENELDEVSFDADYKNDDRANLSDVLQVKRMVLLMNTLTLGKGMI